MGELRVKEVKEEYEKRVLEKTKNVKINEEVQRAKTDQERARVRDVDCVSISEAIRKAQREVRLAEREISFC